MSKTILQNSVSDLSWLLDDCAELIVQFVVLRIQPQLIGIGRNVVSPQHEVAAPPPHHAPSHDKVLLLRLVTKEMPAPELERVVRHTIAASHAHHGTRGVRAHVLTMEIKHQCGDHRK